ncbi:hypothetical protein BT96DRAFT_919945 [Gymnopus androsaceus JB14]|uniref:Uncharacterized protein n=1 Tax=Gymnopus androsaceus JB14 TaxID=1447944 RepID=A0A6A4HNU3_9AGAR|nr:hypothetical protein BT96DRAFT_919945 [Gymnopus androsaceus JB14]
MDARTEIRRLAYNQTNENEAKMQEDLQNIYIFCKQSVSSEESKLSVKAPPAELLIITLRNLIFPCIVLSFIPETLDVLSGIEAWRIKAEKIADQALVSEEYWPNYKVDYPSGLTDDDRRVLRGIVDAHKVERANYVEITKQYCQLHLHNTWTSSSVEQFIKILRKYFPSLAPATNPNEPYPFLQSFSPAELSSFAELKRSWVELIQQITKGNFVQPEIRVPTEVELQAMTESYLVHVQEQNDKLEKLFDAPGYMYRVGTKLEDVDLDEK